MAKIYNAFLTEMDANSKNKVFQKRIHELSKSLEYAKLKITSLEAMIKVVEKDLKIKIRKRSGWHLGIISSYSFIREDE
ncbi:hypothetical protein [Elizabethkingia anophelis]|uniref:hypothetical protein n=1 Tax=Elizabethkingia anophelis TaxID=1117645 RepID=UPI00389180F9